MKEDDLSNDQDLKANQLGLVSVEQVARALHISPRHLRDVVKADIGYIKPGKRIMFRLQDVIAYVERKRRPPLER